MSEATLPAGRLLSWYGDDFTGSAAVMEVLAFGGIECVLFLDIPDEQQLAEFAHCRAIGIAGVARSHTPEWMERHLPPIFHALAHLEAPLAHYKVCSTFDSSPMLGSIGRAIDIAAPVLGGAWHPMLIAAPAIARYQAFGNLFAGGGGVVHRLDRHPVMSRHPVTPMDESDVRLHLARQTDTPIGLIDLLSLRDEDGGQAALDGELRAGKAVIALDIIDEPDLVAAGRLIWEQRGDRLLAIGSQGLEYALLAYWRSIGAIPHAPPSRSAGRVEQIVAVSGSVSPTTAAQIDWSERNGFDLVGFDAASVVDDTTMEAAIERAAASALAALSRGQSVLVYSARGPDDPAVRRFRSAVAGSGMTMPEANARIGQALGRILDRLLARTGFSRAVISGGDTSGHAGLELGVHALTALAPTISGAALCTAHSRRRKPLQLALKGGQMGTSDYFGWIRDGGGPRDTQ